MTCVVGIDIGTTSTIAILIRPPGEVLALVSRPVDLHSARAGWAEEDPQQWWANICAVVPELLKDAGVTAQAVSGIGVTGMLPAMVLLDRGGRVLRPSIQQSDGRCGAEVAELSAEISEADFVAVAGNGINQQLVSAKLRWIEKHEPEIFQQIETVLGSYDYINWRLTGRLAVDRNWALEAGFLSVRERALSDELIALAHVPRSAIPEVTASHEILGVLTAQAANALGLVAGTAVAGGSADHIASAYAAGITASGDVLLKFGGSTDILIATDRVAPDRRMFFDYHLVPGLYMPNGCMASGGSALNWFAEHFAAGEGPAAHNQGLTIHAHLDNLAGDIPAGADGVQVIPYFLGEKTPLHDAQARGTITGLSLNHRPAHIWRALLEGFGYAFRHHVQVFNDMGHATTRYLASDGGARSRLWMQIVSDILQEPVQLLEGHPGSCLGAAWMAAIGVGLSEDWSGPSHFVSLGERIEPNRAHRSLYDAGYERFRAVYQQLAPLELGRPL